MLRQLVERRSKVACIGGYGTPLADPSPRFLSSLVRRKNVTLVDVQDSELLRRLENEYRIKPRDGEGKKILKKRIAVLKQFLRFRYGAVSSYASEVGQGGLLSYRKGISSSRIRLLPGRAWETGIKLHSLDLVVDRGTLGWIYGQGEGRLKRTVAHYIDILREGGKAVLFFNEAEQPNEENVKIRDALKKAGRKNNISVQEISIDSKTVTPGYHGAGASYNKALVVTSLAGAKDGKSSFGKKLLGGLRRMLSRPAS